MTFSFGGRAVSFCSSELCLSSIKISHVPDSSDCVLMNSLNTNEAVLVQGAGRALAQIRVSYKYVYFSPFLITSYCKKTNKQQLIDFFFVSVLSSDPSVLFGPRPRKRTVLSDLNWLHFALSVFCYHDPVCMNLLELLVRG